jgi:hypothetical protein
MTLAVGGRDEQLVDIEGALAHGRNGGHSPVLG